MLKKIMTQSYANLITILVDTKILYKDSNLSARTHKRYRKYHKKRNSFDQNLTLNHSFECDVVFEALLLLV